MAKKMMDDCCKSPKQQNKMAKPGKQKPESGSLMKKSKDAGKKGLRIPK